MSSKDAVPPARLRGANDEPVEGDGLVTASFERGSVVLARGDRRVHAVWEGPDTAAALALPVGTWRVMTTRLVRSHEDVDWFLSSTGLPKREVRVVADGEARITVTPTLAVAPRAKRDGRVLHLGIGITAADGRGLSVYRDGRRVPLRWRALDADGTTVADGAMTYG